MSFIPNTTPTPNWLYNGEMKKMNETELKVVLLVTRKTLGWFDPMTQERKMQDNISQSQFMEFTGKSHTAIAQAIQSSVEQGWIIARDRQGNLCDTSDKRKRRRVWYQLGNIFTDKISKQQSGQDKNLSNISTKSKQHSCLNLSNKVDNTKVTLKETIQKIAPPFGDAKGIEKTIKKKRDKDEPINLEKFAFSMRSGKRRALHIIADWAETVKPNFTTYGQWQVFMKRNLRPATDLEAFSQDQMIRAYQDIMEDSKNGEKFKPTLETLIKYLIK